MFHALYFTDFILSDVDLRLQILRSVILSERELSEAKRARVEGPCVCIWKRKVFRLAIAATRGSGSLNMTGVKLPVISELLLCSGGSHQIREQAISCFRHSRI